MSFIRPQLRPINHLSNFMEELHRPPVDPTAFAPIDTVIPPSAPQRAPDRREGRQGHRVTRRRSTKAGDDDGDGEEPSTPVITDLNALPALLTVDETAAILRTTSNAIYTMASRGRLPGAIHVGRRLLVRRTEFLLFLNEGRVPSPARSR